MQPWDRLASLHLCRVGPLKTKLEARIKALSAHQGGPLFTPHVTLVPAFPAPSDEAAVSSARDALKDLKVGTSVWLLYKNTNWHHISLTNLSSIHLLPQAYHIDLDRVTYGGIFFQCVYILCKPTQEVLDANTLAKERLGFDTGPYMPHLSLLYGGVDEDTRSAL